MCRLYILSVCSAKSVIAWIGNVTAVTLAQWFTVSALREVSTPKTNGPGVNMLACTTYKLYFEGQSVLHALKPLFNLRMALKKWVQWKSYNWNPEAVTRLYQRLHWVALTLDKECEGRQSELVVKPNRKMLISTFQHFRLCIHVQ